ncbi:ATP-dependent Clp protease proteolytic subunit [Candidatus Peregrinibacteria bacterium]|nr:MAG: ATP-dependent Clp protease proteolytic subunit [Candidatus Peregrinibacteria bacterium]
MYFYNSNTSTGSQTIKNMLIPTVIDKTPTGERAYDIFSRLLEDRIVFMGTAIDDNVANCIIAQLLFLEKQNPKKDITMYVNSPGGQVTSTMAMYDTMQYIQPDVSTVCLGMAASGGSILLVGGEKGKRFALPHSEVMIHQPLGGTEGQASDIEIQARHILKTKKILIEIMEERTTQTKKQIEKDMDRDHWLDAEAAKKYGIIDHIITKKEDIKK